MIKYIIQFFLVSVFFFHINIYSQWVETSGPGGGPANVIYSIDNELYAGFSSVNSQGGVWFSSNFGDSWERRNTGLVLGDGYLAPNVSSFTSIGDTIFVVADGSVYKSLNKGLNWTEVYHSAVIPILNIFANNNIIFGGLYNVPGILRSTDFGNTWDFASDTIYASCFVNDEFNNIYVGGFNGVYKSSNNGNSWQKFSPGFEHGVYRLVNIKNFLIVGTLFDGLGKGIFRINKTNQQLSPQLLDSTFNIRDLEKLIISGDTLLYAIINENYSTKFKIYGSSDNGLSWNELQSDGLRNVNILDLNITSEKLFAGTYTRGIFVSTNRGESWEQKNKNLTHTLSTQLKSRNNKIYASTFLAGGFYYSSNDGIDWVEDGNNLGELGSCCEASDRTVNTFLISDTTFFAGTKYSGVYKKSQHNGLWENKSLGLPYYNSLGYFGEIISMVEINSGGNQYLFVSIPLGEGIYISTDNGNSWDTLKTAPPVGFGYFKLFAIESTLFAAHTLGQLYRSTNFGLTWQTVNLPNNGYEITQIILIDNTLFSTSQLGIFKSNDNGMNWEVIESNFSGGVVTSLINIGNNLIAAYASSNKIILSTDFGGTWTPIAEGMPDFTVHSLIATSQYLYASVGFAGVWRRPISDIITSVDKVTELPDKFFLYQNYPNPFNPSTLIEYVIASDKGAKQSVTLKVYDVLGNEVATLVNENQSAGKYNISFNAENLSSGVYYYTLRAGNFVETKKMLLMK